MKEECLELEAATRHSNRSRSAAIARKLAEKKAPISIRISELPLDVPELPVSVKIYIEDRHIAGFYLNWKLVPSTTFGHLKRMMYEKLEFPLEVQRWIVRNRLVSDRETISSTRVKNNEELYLYLLPASTVGVTRDSAQASYLGIPRQASSSALQSGLTPESERSAASLLRSGGPTQFDFPDPQPVESSLDLTLNTKEGWTCPKCTCVNEATRPGCEACSADRPDDYQVPAGYLPSAAEQSRLDRERQLEELAQRELETQQRENLQEILTVYDLPLVRNTEPFTCPICFEDIEPGAGIMLRDCLHSFCEDCLRSQVEASESSVVDCPFAGDNYACNSQLQEREIKALVSGEVYGRLLQLSIQEAESRESQSFHCSTPDCGGWCIYEDEVNVFECPVCGHANCLTCKAQHEGATCREYQETVRARAAVDVAAKKTQKKIDKMLAKGDAMYCPTCHIVVMKKEGCDWIRCSMCKTEICWVTKGPRWGPAGEGDETGGCRCGVDNKLCHPQCQNCH